MSVPVVCKHGDSVDVCELPKALTFTAAPEVAHEDLSPFIQANWGAEVKVGQVSTWVHSSPLLLRICNEFFIHSGYQLPSAS